MSNTGHEAFLRSVLDQLDLGAVVFDTSWTHVFSNLQGRTLLDDLAVFDSEKRLLRLGSVSAWDLEKQANGTPLKLVVDGPPARIIETTVRDATSQAGDPLRLIVMRDVTREQQQYVRAQEQDRLAAMGQLAAGIAHDFNNMLTAMIGYADVLSLGDVTETQKERLQVIADQGRRAEQLVRQVLDFSRQRTTPRTPTDTVALLDKCTGLLGQTLPESIRLRWRPPETPLVATANATQIQEAVTNLVLNARDAMPDGGTIDLATRRIAIPEDERLVTHLSEESDPPPRGGTWIAISVRDTGTGMPPDIVRRAFEPFFTTKPETKGTGLGLAQVYGIVRQHDGYVDVQSEVGVGTTVTLYLPLSRDQAVAETSAADGLCFGNGETVLVVEDDPTVLGVIASMVEGVGYSAVTAAGGREALAELRGGQDFHVVLTDIVMPGITGVALTRQLRQEFPGLPVVLMTGHTIDEPDTVEQLGDGFLSKPVSLDELATTLARVLSADAS